MNHEKYKYWLVCKTCNGADLKVTEHTKMEAILKFLFETHTQHRINAEKFARSGTIISLGEE
jgi:hypothetical protein